MSHWLLDTLSDVRREALMQAERALVFSELLHVPSNVDYALLQRTAEALEMVVLDLSLKKLEDDEEKKKEFRLCAADAFRLLRILPRPIDDLEAGRLLLRAGCLAVLGDQGADAARWLRDEGWIQLPVEADDWRIRTWATIIDVWLRLIRKDGWSDRDAVLERIARLRKAQTIFEREHLDALAPANAKTAALELIGLYHLAKAAEIFALYITDGVVDGKYQIHPLLESHFDRVLAVCNQAQMLDLEPLCRLLAAAASQMAENSIWTVTRSVNSRVTQFVRSLVDRGRGNRAIFDVLPPQRRTLAEKGLLGSSRRAVVVSLPTSSGKTLIAEFRILQALNQFEHEQGWVAYLVPTRTLVNQITRQLRRDLEPLNIIVEQVSPALEIDTIEANLLLERNPANAFRVLVTTPEKLDLMLRQGKESEIGRPLTLVVVDEAHNIQSLDRGLKLELLLATINSECQRAQFLLLTPFIDNAREVARWLGGQNSDDISLALDWQPNDRMIGIVQARKNPTKTHNGPPIQLRIESVHTTRKTMALDELLALPVSHEIASSFDEASTQSNLAAITAQILQDRGPVIVMHQRPDWVWSVAKSLKIDANRKAPTRRIHLVQDFLNLEFGPMFPLIDLLDYGIGVHHGGLSEDTRALMEWLFEENELRFLVATTTIAQGVNFPVSGVIMASHQYPYGKDMPAEDFWNIAGRTGRISQGTLGVVALVADKASKAEKLRDFIHRQTGELNSALIALAREAEDQLGNLKDIVYNYPAWSAFVQYLAHTYRKMGKPKNFANEIEQVLRNTFGFEKLRTENSSLANRLLAGVYAYTEYLQKPGQPIKLVDSTGFSLQSIKTILTKAAKQGITAECWNGDSLFGQRNPDLQVMMGVLLKVPELRKQLSAVTGGKSPDGNKLASILKDWVNGKSVPEIAERYFSKDGRDADNAMTECGKNLFGRLTQTAAWGLGALLSITGEKIPEARMRTLSNLPSRIYYGVNTDEAVALRLLGVPRSAATKLSQKMDISLNEPLPGIRKRLRSLDERTWEQALGAQAGGVYRSVWRVLEGLE